MITGADVSSGNLKFPFECRKIGSVVPTGARYPSCELATPCRLRPCDSYRITRTTTCTLSLCIFWLEEIEYSLGTNRCNTLNNCCGSFTTSGKSATKSTNSRPQQYFSARAL